MIYFILGQIAGIILSIVVILVVSRYNKPINRFLDKIEVKNNKGEIFYDTDEKKEFENLLDNLPKQ